jgi:vacuolar protein sorting-associated protein 26
VVVGKIYFLLVRIKLKHMEVEIRRRETTGDAHGGSSSALAALHCSMAAAWLRGLLCALSKEVHTACANSS